MQIAALFIAALKHQTFLAKRLSSTLCVIDRTPNVLFNPGQKCIFSTFSPSSNVLFDRGSFCTFSPLSHGGGGGASPLLLQMFFLNPGNIVPSHLCCLCFPCLNVLFKPRAELYLLTSACEGGGGGKANDLPKGV